MIQADGITLGQAEGIGWQGNSNALRQMDLKPRVFNTFEPTEFVELKSVGVNLVNTMYFWYFSALLQAARRWRGSGQWLLRKCSWEPEPCNWLLLCEIWLPRKLSRELGTSQLSVIELKSAMHIFEGAGNFPIECY